jgi:type IV secretory pathway component VirB8
MGKLTKSRQTPLKIACYFVVVVVVVVIVVALVT